MPWKETSKMDERERFVLRVLEGEQISTLCKEYGISRTTGHKFVKRFKNDGVRGLKDLSRRPIKSPNKTSVFMEKIIIAEKFKHHSWGPKKLRARITKDYPQLEVPSPSTIGAILSRHGLASKGARKIQRGYLPSHLTNGKYPNNVWCIDYKGQFKTQDGKYCYPLTVTDHYSRFLISCEACSGTDTEKAYKALREAFLRHGIPEIIRSDNGSPFASSSHIYGLSRLSVWLLSLGIKLERIEPGHPEQNGRHERMHRTLKRDAINPPAKNILSQQETFDKYIKTYNYERPHEALNMSTPSEVYTPSEKKYFERDSSYLEHDFTRRVDCSGRISLPKTKPSVLISKIFYGHTLGLKEQDSSYIVTFFEYDIGIIDKNTLTFECFEILNS